MTEYAITEYPDVKGVYEKANSLLRTQPVSISSDQKKRVLKYYSERCGKSKEIIEKAKQVIPGGVQHNLAFNFPFPLVISKGEGAHLYDIDGNRYIDFLQAGGATMLGSNYEPVREKVLDLIGQTGPSTGLFHEYELKLAAEIVKHVESVDMFRMLGSGTESVMAAIRVARLATGNKKVIKQGAGYHGWSDQLVYGLHIPGTRRYEAHGIPSNVSKHTQEVYPNSIDSLRKKLRLNRIRGGTAAVILEPLGPESGTRPVDREYPREVAELCEDYGTLLIFDEVVTGFRIGLKGAQGYFGVRPDLTTFGKIVAGGYPGAGGLGGRKELMEYLAAGVESGKKRAYVGGTLAATPLSSAAGYFTIKELEKTEACVKAGKFGDRLTKGLTEILEDNSLPFVVFNQGSIVHLETVATMFTDLKINFNILKTIKDVKNRKHKMEEMGAAYTAQGIITLAGSRMYTSLATDEKVIDEALGRFSEVFKEMEVRS